jgi:hypothetical protein
MNTRELEAIESLRKKGYAVAIWEPEDVGIADPRALEDQAINSFPCGYPHKPTLMEIETAGDNVSFYVAHTYVLQAVICAVYALL